LVPYDTVSTPAPTRPIWYSFQFPTPVATRLTLGCMGELPGRKQADCQPNNGTHSPFFDFVVDGLLPLLNGMHLWRAGRCLRGRVHVISVAVCLRPRFLVDPCMSPKSYFCSEARQLGCREAGTESRTGGSSMSQVSSRRLVLLLPHHVVSPGPKSNLRSSQTQHTKTTLLLPLRG
jgi:hypothetical protein